MKLQSHLTSLKSFFLLMSTCLVLFAAKPGFCVEDPVKMLQSVTNNVLNQLRAHRDEFRFNPKQIYSVIDRTIMPHVDFTEMARWVVGRNAWAKADSNTQQTFVKEFSTMVVNSYGRALLEYNDQKIEFLPLRGSAEGKDRIQVSSYLKDNGKSIRMDYRLIRQGNTWRVYDIIIEGVSLMQGYRAQFAEDVRHSGVAGAVMRMREHSTGMKRPR